VAVRNFFDDATKILQKKLFSINNGEKQAPKNSSDSQESKLF
jgi:hypothetical protein